jgi:hypothetical protein
MRAVEFCALAGGSRSAEREGQMKISRILRGALAVAAVSLTAACSTHNVIPEVPGTGDVFTLLIENPQPYSMNVLYSFGPTQTALGRVDAGQTMQYSIPDRGGDKVEITAGDQTMQHMMTKRLDLDRGKINKVTLRD